MIYHSYLKECKLIYVASLFVQYKTKKNYVVHVRALKQALNHGLKLKKQFNQKAWLKSYIDMNNELRKKKQKTILRKISVG